MGVRHVAAIVACALVPWIAAQERGGADPTRETVVRTAIEIEPGREVVLEYRTIAWSDVAIANQRADPEARAQMNQRLPIGLQSKLTTPVALLIEGRRVEPDTYRIGVWMDEAGAHQFSILLDHEYVRFPLDLAETDQRFPYLTFTLLPASEGGFALIFQWGGEYGRVVLDVAH